MRENGVLIEHPSAFGVVSRMPKRQRTAKHARIQVKLDTVMGVAREMGRLIRLSYNGHLPPEELTKYVFALDKLRNCLESAAAIETAAAAATPPNYSTVVNVISVPSNQFINRENAEAPVTLSSHDEQALIEPPPPEPKEMQIDDAGIEAIEVSAPEPEPKLEPMPQLSDNLARQFGEFFRTDGGEHGARMREIALRRAAIEAAEVETDAGFYVSKRRR